MRSSLPLASAALLLATTALAQAPPLVTEGRIVDQHGEALPAARIEAQANGRVVAHTLADGDGVYLLRLPAPGAELRVRAEGKVTARLPWRGPTTPRVRNVMLEDGGAVRGRVVSAAGAPVAGATVSIVAGNTTVTAIADGDGAFAMDGVPMRAGFVRAVGEAGWVERRLHVSLDTRCDLEVPAGGRQAFLVGVEGASAEAIAGALVRVFGPDVAAMQNDGRVPLRADGTAALSLASTCLLELSVPQRASVSRFVTPYSTSTTFRFADLAAPAAPTRVRGRVRTAEDRIAGNVRLFVRDRSRCDYAAIAVDGDGNFDVDCALPPDGVCKFGLPLGDWLLVGDDAAIADGCSWISVWNATKPIELRVEPAGRIDAVVQGPDGRRFALADVVIADSEHPERPLLRTCADREGRLELGLPAGEHDLLAFTHDGKVVGATMNVVAGALRAPEWKAVATGEITGVMRDAAGVPVAGVELLACSDALQIGNTLRAGLRQRCTVVTDRSGRFRWRGLPAAQWTIAAPHDERAGTATATVVADTVQSVELAYAR